MTYEELKKILPSIPQSAGCYQYFDKNGEILYVGKAKNLKKRISSYFSKEHKDRKTQILVNKIFDIKYILVQDEGEALLLENNLIKTLQPKYNILLKDGKTYPYIAIIQEDFSRIFITRNKEQLKGDFFGPYPNVGKAKQMIQLLRELYPIRTCKLNLSAENLKKKSFEKCLQFHIKKCLAPCEENISLLEYQSFIDEAKDILKGNFSPLIKETKRKMLFFAQKEEFEKAENERIKLNLLENFSSKSVIAPSIFVHTDIFSYTEEKDTSYVNFLQIHNSSIIRVLTVEWKNSSIEKKEDLLPLVITELRERLQSEAKEIIIPFSINWIPKGVSKITIPQKGEKKKLLDLSQLNVQQYKFDKLKRKEYLNSEQRELKLMERMKEDLHLPSLPKHIECFDNSNIQGTSPVASCVVFRNAKPSKKEYTKFHVKTVVGANDFASMEEIVFRRYYRQISEKKELPNLIVIDGGKGQLKSATTALRELGILNKVTVIGLAKRMEEVFFVGNPDPLFLKRDSDSLKVLQHIRDEAHRFGITFHRSIRSKKLTQSQLDNIKGIGDKSKEILFQQFKSLKRIQEASFEELAKEIGYSRAKLVYEALKNKVE